MCGILAHSKGYLVKFYCSMVIAMTVIICKPANASELTENYYSVRALGMGGAFTAIANDENSIWTNPAGLTRIRKARSRETFHIGRFPNISFGSNGNTTAFLDAFQGSSTAEDIIAEAENDDGKPLWLNLSVAPMVIFDAGGNTYGVGAYLNTVARLYIDPENAETTQINTVADVAGIFSMGWSNRTNRFNIGAQLRPVSRFGYEDYIPTEELDNNDELQIRIAEGSNQTFGIGLDVGMMFTFADFWFPTIGVAVRNLPTGCNSEYLNPFSKLRQNVCGTDYFGDISNPDALSTLDPTDIRVGASITPRLTRQVAMRLALDVHRIHYFDGTNHYGLDEVDLLKKLHAGFEVFFGNPLEPSNFSFRGGMGQGFLSAGMTAKFSLFAIEFATFGRDISSTQRPREHRRFMVNLSIQF